MASNQYQSALEQARSEIKGMLNDFNEVDKKILQIAANAAKIGKTDFSGGSPKELNERLQKNATYRKQVNAEMKEAERLNKALAAAQAKFYSAQSGTNKQLQQTRLETNILNKEQRDAAKLNSRLTTAYEKQSATLNKLRREAKGAAVEYGINSKEATKLRNEVNKLDSQLKKVDESLGQSQRFVGKYERGWRGAASGLKNVFTSLVGAFGIVEGLRIGIDFTKDSIRMAKEAKGVEYAFRQLGETGQDAFNRVKTATRGALSDLSIKTALNEFKQFNLSVERTDTLFEFLAVAAAQTGKSVDELKSSLVEGLSKESKLRIDNLGISAGELNAELEKTPDFLEAVANIAERKVKDAGDILDEAGNSTEKWNAALNNTKVAFGNLLTGNNTGFLGSLADALNRISEEIDYLNNAIGIAKGGFNQFLTEVKNVIKQVPFLETFLKSAASAASAFFSALSISGLQVFGVTLTVLGKTFAGVGSAISQARKEVGLFIEGFSLMASALVNPVKLAKQIANGELKEQIKKLTAQAVNGGSNIANAFAEGYKNATVGVAQAVEDMVKANVKAARSIATINAEIEEQQLLLQNATTREEAKAIQNKVTALEAERNAIIGSTEAKNEGIQALDGSIAAMEQVILTLEEEQSKLAVSDKRWASYEKSIKDAKDALAQLKVEYAGIQVLFEQEGVKDFDPFDYDLMTESQKEAYNQLIDNANKAKDELARINDEILRDDEDTADEKLEKFKKTFEEISSVASQNLNNIQEVFNGIYQARINTLENQQARNDEYYNSLLANERLTAEQRDEIEQERAEKELILQRKIREERRKQAIADKAFAIADIVINTARAVIATLGETGFFGTPLAAIVSAIGAAQIAVVASTPIPALEQGDLTGKHEGLVQINDARGAQFKEIIQRANGEMEVYGGRNVLIDKKRGDKVYKAGTAPAGYDYNDIMNASINMSLADQHGRLSQAEARQSFDSEMIRQTMESELKKAVSAIKGIKINNTINNKSSDFAAYRAAKFKRRA